MTRGPITPSEIAALDDMSSLAESIYAQAAGLDKHPRHVISDAAKLIQWVCYEYQHPGEVEATEAIKALRAALANA
jgi:hypothetical protein